MLVDKKLRVTFALALRKRDPERGFGKAKMIVTEGGRQEVPEGTRARKRENGGDLVFFSGSDNVL